MQSGLNVLATSVSGSDPITDYPPRDAPPIRVMLLNDRAEKRPDEPRRFARRAQPHPWADAYTMSHVACCGIPREIWWPLGRERRPGHRPGRTEVASNR